MLGSDGLGRDLYSRIVYGSRVSMCVGLIGVLISFSLGITIGALSGYIGGTVDFLIMRWSEIEMSLPSFYFLLALAAVIPSGMSTVTTFFMIVAIMSFISWAGFARIIRGMASSVRSRPYVEAARALGASRWRIITQHIIPSVIGYAIVAATLSVPASSSAKVRCRCWVSASRSRPQAGATCSRRRRTCRTSRATHGS